MFFNKKMKWFFSHIDKDVFSKTAMETRFSRHESCDQQLDVATARDDEDDRKCLGGWFCVFFFFWAMCSWLHQSFHSITVHKTLCIIQTCWIHNSSVNSQISPKRCVRTVIIFNEQAYLLVRDTRQLLFVFQTLQKPSHLFLVCLFMLIIWNFLPVPLLNVLQKWVYWSLRVCTCTITPFLC